MSQFNIKLFLKSGYSTSGAGALFSTMQSGFVEALNKAKQNPFDIKLEPSEYPSQFRAHVSLRIEAKDVFDAHVKAKDIACEIESYDGQSHERTFLIERYEITEQQ
jgi:hypothetical protein